MVIGTVPRRIDAHDLADDALFVLQHAGVSQAAAGAVTGDHQLGRVGTQFSGVCVHPLYGAPCIFHRSGEGVLGGQTVLREHHHGTGLLGNVLHLLAEQVNVTGRESTAVQVHQHRCVGLDVGSTVDVDINLVPADGDQLFGAVHRRFDQVIGHLVRSVALAGKGPACLGAVGKHGALFDDDLPQAGIQMGRLRIRHRFEQYGDPVHLFGELVLMDLGDKGLIV